MKKFFSAVLFQLLALGLPPSLCGCASASGAGGLQLSSVYRAAYRALQAVCRVAPALPEPAAPAPDAGASGGEAAPQ